MTDQFRAYLLDTRFSTLELLRLPAYSVPSLLLPAMLYVFFGLAFSHNHQLAPYALASYAAFAVIGVALFQFGVGIAMDRHSPWEGYMRTLPISASARIFARLTSALLFASSAALLVILCGVVLGHVYLAPETWLRFASALLVGGITFAIAGMAIGYWTTPKTSVPITNLTYLPLAFIGGLWLPPQFLPPIVATISPCTPTRQFGELVWAAASNHPWEARSFVTLFAYAAVFGVIAIIGYRRNELERYG